MSDRWFFRETLKERDINYINKERKKRLDYTYYHRQRRYIVQELIDDNFFNPTHHSFKPREIDSIIDFYDIETFDIAKDRTTIVIAHRLSTILNSDKIFVVEKGEILTSGRHEELIKNSDQYIY